MKRILIFTVISFFLATSCSTSTTPPVCTDVAPSAEEPAILSYCGANGIAYTKDVSGLYYQIIDSGAAPIPVANSQISITYVAKLLDGTTIDQKTTPITNTLSDLIESWKIGMKLIGKGGRIKLVAPSSLCYGCYGTKMAAFEVPANAILYFDITLTDVK